MDNLPFSAKNLHNLDFYAFFVDLSQFFCQINTHVTYQ